MRKQQQALIIACDKLGVKYTVIGQDKIAIKLHTNPPLFSINHLNPFISYATSRLLKDKSLTYQLLNKKITMPKQISFFDPNTNQEHSEFVKYKDINQILSKIEKEFTYPVIVKKNQGSIGVNVFKCENKNQVAQSLNKIFDKNSRHYDYIALVESYIDIAFEYRVITIQNKIELLYLKDNRNAKFIGNLSPLHFEGSKAVDINDKKLFTQFEEFIAPVFDEIDIPYAGFDIAIDSNNKMWLIEVNGSPSFEIYIRDNATKKVEGFYSKCLKLYINS